MSGNKEVGKLCECSHKIIKLLTNTKKSAKGRLTRGYLDTRLESLTEYWQNYNKQYELVIGSLTKEELEKYDVEANYESAEEAFLGLKTWIKDYLYGLEPSTMDTSTTETVKSIKPKLPPVPLPKFSGDYCEWISFRDIFQSLIHKDTRLSNVEKHHYLRSSLIGEAAQLLKNFSLTDANYVDAWKKLEERYDSKRVIVNTILNRLLNQKKLPGESAKLLKELLDTTCQCLDSLKNMNIDISNWDAILVHLTVSKLDSESHRLWEQSLGNSTDIPAFSELSSFIEARFRSLEMIKQPFVPSKVNVKSFNTTEASSTCTFCSQNHYICHCKEFSSLTIPERQKFIKDNNLCFNCLVKGHSVTHCRQSTSCRKCGRRHHSLLHFTNPNKADTPQESTPVSCNNTHMNSGQVILATAQIQAIAKNGSTHTLRALVDPGSQASFLTEAAAQLLNLHRTPIDGKVSGIANSSVVTTKSIVTLNIKDKYTPTATIEVKAYVLKKLTSLLPSREFPQSTWPYSLQLADPDYHKPGVIDVLLGAEVHAHLLLEGLHKHKSLVAINTRLGWLISGRVLEKDHTKHNVIVITQ